LRSAPKLRAKLLDRAMLNDQLVLADDSNPEWVGVRPPKRIDLWVKDEYVEDGKVKPSRLNVRSGPSLSHDVVGEAVRGETLTPRGELGGWLRIAPPARSVVWISRKYTSLPSAKEAKPVASKQPVLITLDAEKSAMPEKPVPSDDPDAPVLIMLDGQKPIGPKKPVIHIKVEPSEPAPAKIIDAGPPPAEPKPKKVKKPAAKKVVKKPVIKEEPKKPAVKVVQPVINDVLVAASTVTELPEVLKPTPGKEQGVKGAFSGILRPANAVLYKLVDPGSHDRVVCYVRGNPVQMEGFAGRALTISGRTYWANGLKQPLLVPEQIKLLSQSPAE